MRQILGGKTDARAQINSNDEIEDLADAFNEMVNRLQLSLQNLKSRSEALEESEEKYRLIVENSNDIIITITPEGEVSLLNKGISGATREELLHELTSDDHYQPPVPEQIRNLPLTFIAC